MSELIHSSYASLPPWMQDSLHILVPLAEVVLIVFIAWLLNLLVKRLIRRAADHYMVARQLLAPLRALLRWLIMLIAAILVVERLGVSGPNIWAALTAFAAVGAVAFFAAWSVLSNLFSALLILIVRPFRMGDRIEVLERLDKPGTCGRVVDINLIYITLEENEGGETRLLQIPNTYMFQRVMRRWPRDAGTARQPAQAPTQQRLSSVRADGDQSASG